MNEIKEGIRSQPRYLWFLTMTYVIVLLFANWFDPRLVSIFGLVTDAGTLIFPVTFLLADVITEVYGYKCARLAIWLGFLFNVFFILYGQLVVYLPSPAYATNNILFAKILALDLRVIVASIVSYICAEPLNSFIMAKLKIVMQGKLLWMRFVTSTFIAAIVDSMIFGCIAFYGVLSINHLFYLIFSMWLIKVLIEVLGLPISIYLARRLKAIEKIDIYDTNTNFNLFKLEVSYNKAANKYNN